MDSQIHPPNVSNFKEQHSQQAALSMTPSLGSLGGRFFSRSWRRHIWELDMTWHDMTSFESACMEFTLVFFHSMVLHTFGWMEVLVAGIRLVWAALHYPLQRWRQWWLLGLWDLEVCRCWFSIPLGNLHYRMGVYHPKVMPNGMIFSCCWLEFWYKIRMIIRSPHWFDWFSMNDSSMIGELISSCIDLSPANRRSNSHAWTSRGGRKAGNSAKIRLLQRLTLFMALITHLQYHDHQPNVGKYTSPMDPMMGSIGKRGKS